MFKYISISINIGGIDHPRRSFSIMDIVEISNSPGVTPDYSICLTVLLYT